jgi:phosphoglucosamine mutase
MTRKFFGTDGVRGTANIYPMTADMALRIGAAAGRYFRNDGSNGHRVVIGKDTRLSGYMFENALTAGLTSTGMNVLLLGPVPTPAVGLLTTSMRADLGIMISASHNPHHDNGIKFFGPDGFKLSDAAEEQIEALIASDVDPAKAANIGRAKRTAQSDLSRRHAARRAQGRGGLRQWRRLQGRARGFVGTGCHRHQGRRGP